MTGKITTLLFDLDGTLINTNELIIKTFQVTLQEFLPDRVFTREDILPFIGLFFNGNVSGNKSSAC